MYNSLTKCIEKQTKLFHGFHVFISKVSKRYLSAAEISTALRPFYFSVHPDLFGKYPTQRNTNENSLKQLSAFIETSQSKKAFKPCILKFYLRVKNAENLEKFRLVEISLKEPNVRNAIISILKTCNLSTEYIEGRTVKSEFSEPKQSYSYNNEYDADNIKIIRKKINKVKEAMTLSDFLNENYKNALEKNEGNRIIKKEIRSICKDIYRNFDVKEIRWDCGWNEMHFRGCLQSFQALANDHPQKMNVLKNRILVFAPFTGVSLDGHIMLSSGEVRHNWLDLIKNVNKYDVALLRIPSFEKALSQVLKNIQVGRRKFMPKILAAEYEKHLSQLMTTINDYCGFRGLPNNWPTSLKNHQIVVETEAGPLMVSPTGQFIVPSSCPGFLLINFMTDNLDLAAKKIVQYNTHKHIEKFLHALCIKELKLADLRKDDNVTPELMITCCELLLEHKDNLKLLRNLHLNICTYYSVLTDGTVCIPWNFKI